MGLVTAANTGNRLTTLVALRDRLAEEIDVTTSARDLAALSRQLTEVLREINDLPEPDKESKAQEIARKREERRSGNEGD